MDTTEIPEFKIAKVGKERRRRGAGLPFLFRRAGSGGGLFGLGGSGAGGGAAGGLSLLGKTLVLGLIGTMSAGAWQFGKTMRPEVEGAGGKKQIFASPNGEYSAADLANLLGSDNRSMPNSLGYVKGSLDGLTPEERARKAAEEEEARRKAEEEARIAEEEARRAEEEQAKQGVPGGVDPNALLKGMAGKDGQKGGFDKKFGTLSSSFGGGGSGLAGGAGLAGGVNRGFSAPAFKNEKPASGKLAAMRTSARPTVSRAGRGAIGANSNRGFARRQLAHAHGLSNQAVAARQAESSAEAANGAFDNNRGSGNLIAGPGLAPGSGGTPVGPSTVGTNPGTGGGTGRPLDPNQDGASIPNQAGRNVTKYQPLIMAAQALLGIVALLSIAVLAFQGSIVGQPIARVLQTIIGVLGGLIALLGIAIMSAYGQILQGGIFTAVGALIATMAFVNPSFLGISSQVVTAAAGGLVGSALGLLGSVFGGNRGGSAAMS